MALLLVIVIMTTALVCIRKRYCSHQPPCLQPYVSHPLRHLVGRESLALDIQYICI